MDTHMHAATDLPVSTNLENNDPLKIPEILSILLSNISSPDDIKSCRLVSKLWNETITPQSTSQFQLNLDTEIKMTKFCEDMHDTANFPFARFTIRANKISLDSIQHFCTLYGSVIRELRINPEGEALWGDDEDDDNIFLKIIHMLNNIPKLDSLAILEIDESHYRKHSFEWDRSNLGIFFYNLSKLSFLTMCVADEGIAFYEEILRYASNVSKLNIKKSEEQSLQEDNALILGNSLTSRRLQLKSLELDGVPNAFLTNLGNFPALKKLNIARMPLRNEAEGEIFQRFLATHANNLVQLRLGEGVCFEDAVIIPIEFPVFPQLTFLGLTETNLFGGIHPSLVPVLNTIRSTPKTVLDRFHGSFGSVQVVTLTLLNGYNTLNSIVVVLPSVKSSFPSLKTFKFVMSEAEELEWLFQHLQQLEELEVDFGGYYRHVDYDFNSVLSGMDTAICNFIFESFLDDKQNVAEIQAAAKIFLEAKANRNKNSIRNMTHLKRLHVKMESCDVTDACVFLSLLQMNPFLEHLVLENSDISDRSFSLITPCIKRIDRNFHGAEEE